MSERVFPEMRAGGFPRRDGTIQFYTRVRALCDAETVVCDLGAGRGEWLEDEVVFRRGLRDLRGTAARIIGVDVDPAVGENPYLDEHRLMENFVDLPLEDSSVDLVVSDHTFEHVQQPVELAQSIQRVLRPGGWLCARTPNRWGYIGVATNLVPNRHHVTVLGSAQPHRKAEDVFPTVYALNTRRQVRRAFPAHDWDVFMHTFNPVPAYFGDSPALIGMVDAVQTKLPARFGATWHIFARKK